MTTKILPDGTSERPWLIGAQILKDDFLVVEKNDFSCPESISQAGGNEVLGPEGYECEGLRISPKDAKFLFLAINEHDSLIALEQASNTALKLLGIPEHVSSKSIAEAVVTLSLALTHVNKTREQLKKYEQ